CRRRGAVRRTRPARRSVLRAQPPRSPAGHRPEAAPAPSTRRHRRPPRRSRGGPRPAPRRGSASGGARAGASRRRVTRWGATGAADAANEEGEARRWRGAPRPTSRERGRAPLRALLGADAPVRAHLVDPDRAELGVVPVLPDPQLALGARAHGSSSIPPLAE